jgi:hypothetical protein
MRTIRVSTAVFAAIWKAQSPGERSETAILARLLGVAAKRRQSSVVPPKNSDEVDWSDVEA